jgi:osmotically-inducible protein OsmY
MRVKTRRILHATATSLFLLTAYGCLAATGTQDARQHPVLIDSDLELEVEKTLSEEPLVESHEIVVIVDGGEAFLFGAVDSEGEKEIAESIASKVEGIVSVSNQLSVAPGPSLAGKKDAEIEQSVGVALAETLGKQADGIEIVVDRGMVTLKGVVETRRQLRRAVETAFASGAVLVKNRLEIREQTRIPD